MAEINDALPKFLDESGPPWKGMWRRGGDSKIPTKDTTGRNHNLSRHFSKTALPFTTLMIA
jgi:hypothetical protein